MKYILPSLFLVFASLSTFAVAPLESSKKPKITKKCDENEECLAGALLKFVKETSTYSEPAGKPTGALKNGYVLVLNLEVWNYSEKEKKTWLHVKTEDDRHLWILQGETVNRVDYYSEEDIQTIKERGQRVEKNKILSESDMIKKANGDILFDLSAIFKIKKVLGVNLPFFHEGELLFSARNKRNPHAEGIAGAYYFPSCAALVKTLRTKMDYKTVGSTPYQIRYNGLFVEKNGEILTSAFQNRCRTYVDDNTATCPEYGFSYEKLAGKFGPLAVFEHGGSGGGGCGPTYSSKLLKTLDLKTGQGALITDYFDESDLVDAVKNDPYAKEKIDEKTLSTLNTWAPLESELEVQAFGVYEQETRDERMSVSIAFNDNEVLHMSSYQSIVVRVKPKKEFLAEIKKLNPKTELYLKDSIEM